MAKNVRRGEEWMQAAYRVEGRDFDADRLNLLVETLRSPALDLYDFIHTKSPPSL